MAPGVLSREEQLDLQLLVSMPGEGSWCTYRMVLAVWQQSKTILRILSKWEMGGEKM